MLYVLAYFAVLAIVAYLALTRLKTMAGLSTLVLNENALQQGLKWLPGVSKASGKSETEDESFLDEKDGKYLPGLWNLSGSTCFLNSSLQAMASLPSLKHFLASIQALALSTNTHAPVTSALVRLYDDLNKASTSQRTLKPNAIIDALYESVPRRARAILNSDQQDAQEFFVLLLAAVLEELQKMEKIVQEQALTEEGFNTLEREKSPSPKDSKPIKNPFQSLLAHRTACVTCSYVEAIRHLSSDQLSLNVPLKASCHLDEVLEDYTKLEVIDEYTCRRCSLRATAAHLEEQVEAAKTPSSEGETLTTSRKKRIREMNKQIKEVKQALKQDVERELGDIKLVRMSRPATKHSMLARPADSVVIHLSRSTHWSRYGQPIKNTCAVYFDEYLNLDPFTTSGQLSNRPEAPISRFDSKLSSEPNEEAADPSKPPENLYRLVAMIVHLGSHTYGHYVCFRRRANGSSDDGWYRISDENVRPCSVDEVLNANPFLLFYERIGSSQINTAISKHARTTFHARTIQRSDLKTS